MENDANLATQEPVEQSQGGEPTTGNETPFLSINDRTVYKTSEDAIRGFNEAQTRITSLSGYEKVLKDLGVEQPDPELAKALFLELIQHRSDKKKAEDAAKAKTTSSEADKEFEGMAPEEIAKAKAARAWFVKEAEKNGYVSKKMVDELKAQIEELKGGITAEKASAADAQKTEAQEKLSGWLKEANQTLTDPERLKLENCIAAWINSDGPDPAKNTLLAQWARGGDSAFKLIREGAEMFLPIVKKGASLSKAAAVASGAKTKLDLMRKSSEPFPKPGTGKQPVAVQQNQPKKKIDITDDSYAEQAKALLASLQE